VHFDPTEYDTSILTRRETISLLGLGALSIPGTIATVAPETLVGHPRATGEPISVEREITDEGYSYDPASDTVTWPRESVDEGPYETEPFEAWADRRSARVGSDVVLPTINDRLETDMSGIGKAVSGEWFGLVISVTIGTSYDRDGDVRSEPTVSKAALIDAAPRTVHVTISLEGREFARSVPVFVEEVDSHLL